MGTVATLGGGSSFQSNILSTDTTVTADSTFFVSHQLEVSADITLEAAAGAYIHVG